MNLSTHLIVRGATFIFAALVLCISTGCKSYQLGHPSELPFETIFVQAAKNDSFAPQAQAIVSSKVREAMIRDGRVKLIAKESEADVVLVMTLTDFSRKEGPRRQDDTEVAQDYDLSLHLQLDLYDQREGSYLFQGRKVEAKTKAYVDNPFATKWSRNTQSLIQSEYNAIPRLARELGQKAADEVLSAW